MQNSILPIAALYVSGATPITFEQAAAFLSQADIANGSQRFDHAQRFPWGITVSLSGLAVSHNFETGALVIWGKRKLSAPRESGYCYEGRVSVGGTSFRAFTSSMLFQLPDGKLVDVAILHVCDNAPVPAL